jgi:hypothetical protein
LSGRYRSDEGKPISNIYERIAPLSTDIAAASVA